MKKLILLVVGVALLTVACKAEVNVLVDINDDESGTVAFEFGLDDELRGLLEGMLAPNPRDRQGQVVERGAMVLARIVAIRALFQQTARLVGLIRLVAMHRPRIEPVSPKEKRPDRDRDQQPGQY